MRLVIIIVGIIPLAILILLGSPIVAAAYLRHVATGAKAIIFTAHHMVRGPCICHMQYHILCLSVDT